MNYTVFKFSAINKNFIDSLIKNYIYCAVPSSLNDPFDCKVNVLDSIERAISASTGDAVSNLIHLKHNNEFLYLINQSISKTGVCSFSQDLLKPVLWSHYADEHKGICCTYDIPSEHINWDVNKIIGMSDVSYGDNKVTEALMNIANKLPSMENADIYKEITIPILSSKGTDWAYENEVRIIREKAGALALEKDFLKQICFGLHTPERDKELIYSIIDKSGYKPDLCEIAKSNSDFGLSVKDL